MQPPLKVLKLYHEFVKHKKEVKIFGGLCEQLQSMAEIYFFS